ncbi:MAG: DUF3383 domain-containing protein [FCB group bacterium]|nr:DUF3383 domain-containing protein [FCB group bacterium]
MSLSDIVNPVITTDASGPTSTGFGIPMVLTYHTNYVDRARSYTNTTDMVTDGFTATDPGVLAVGAIFSQTPRPKRVIVGRAANDGKMKITLTPVALDDTDYAVTINGQEATIDSGTSATVATIIAALKVAIDALSENVLVTDNTTTMDIEAVAIADVFTIFVNDHALFKYEDVTPDAGGTSGIADDIADVILANDDWYCLIPTNKGKAVLTAAAVAIEALKKIMVVSSADTEIYDSGVSDDIASTLQTANYARTALMFHPKASSQFAGAAWAGKLLPYDPGSITWMFWELNGVDATTLTDAQETTIKGKDCNYNSTLAGLAITRWGGMSSGTYIDLTRSSDWTFARLQEYILGVLVGAKKVPFTDAGVQVVVTQCRAVIEEGIRKGMFADSPAPTYQFPLVADVSTDQKQARNLPDIQITATFAGAIHSVDPLNVQLSV